MSDWVGEGLTLDLHLDMSVTNWLKLPLLAANYDGMMSLRKKMVVV